jgi:acylglycerol lipase
MNFRFVCALVLATLLISSAPAPANAWWLFFKHKPNLFHKVEKKPRQIVGASVGLVPGMPPALVWKGDAKPRAAVLCLHELGFYSGNFDDLGNRLSKQGMIVYAIDERGFGGWSDIPGKESKMDMDRIVKDIKDSAEVIHKLNPNTPLFLLGEAMGGSLVLKVAADNPQLVSGVITAAPAGDHYNSSKNYAVVTKEIIKGGPNEVCDYGDQLMESATPREELRTAFREDPKVRLDLAPRELMACQFFMYKTKAMAKQIKETPVLVVHGAKDGESKESGSADIYKALKTKDKDYLVLPDGDHYTYEDIKVSSTAFDKTLAWIEKHLAQ